MAHALKSEKNLPGWLKIRPPDNWFQDVRETVARHRLHTVCEEAHCPNISACWSGGTATFMIMGDICTRGCRFCAVKTGRPGPLDEDEPKKIARAIKELRLFDYLVITSVDRDDLPDQGAVHFAACIREVKKAVPGILVEVLIPDFHADKGLLKKVVSAHPDVIGHNVETVRRLSRRVRDVRANFDQSLGVLQQVKTLDKTIYTKSSCMLGLGERENEVVKTMLELRDKEVDFLTLGQYLRPSGWHLPVQEFITPEKFKYYQTLAQDMGFLYCAAGPFVRTSYRAGEYFKKKVAQNG